MLLRTSLDRVVPHRRDERHLTDEARRRTFVGNYLDRGRIVRVIGLDGPAPSGSAQPHVDTAVVRQRHGYDVYSNDPTHNVRPRRHPTTAASAASEELADPAALNRANRIETLARRTKGTVAGLVVLAGLYWGVPWDKGPVTKVDPVVTTTSLTHVSSPPPRSDVRHAWDQARLVIGQQRSSMLRGMPMVPA